MVDSDGKHILVAEVEIAEIEPDLQQSDILSARDCDGRRIFSKTGHILKPYVATVGETGRIQIVESVGMHDIDRDIRGVDSRTRHLYGQLIVRQTVLPVEGSAVVVDAGEGDVDRSDTYAAAFGVERSYKTDIVLILLVVPVIVAGCEAEGGHAHEAICKNILEIHMEKILEESMPSRILHKILIALDFIGGNGPEIHFVGENCREVIDGHNLVEVGFLVDSHQDVATVDGE